MKRVHPLFLLMIGALMAGGGCYTVLRHPVTHDLSDDHGLQRACADCHADADLYHYTEAYGGDWYSYYPAPWAYYYQSPWWYEDYWYYSPDPNGGQGTPSSGDRHLWDRGGSNPDYVPSQGGPAIKVSPPSPEPERSNDQETEKPKKEKKRRLWGR